MLLKVRKFRTVHAITLRLGEYNVRYKRPRTLCFLHTNLPWITSIIRLDKRTTVVVIPRRGVTAGIPAELVTYWLYRLEMSIALAENGGSEVRATSEVERKCFQRANAIYISKIRQ